MIKSDMCLTHIRLSACYWVEYRLTIVLSGTSETIGLPIVADYTAMDSGLSGRFLSISCHRPLRAMKYAADCIAVPRLLAD